MASQPGTSLGHTLVPEAARSVIHKPLPPLPTAQQPDADGNSPVTLLLFYQYIEPAWTPKEHKAAVKFVLKLGRETEVCGRGRCAAEGLNCSLTGSAEGIRAFCEGLRRWKPIFLETDFKLTDGVPHAQRFKALTIRKTDELVAYGLAGEKAGEKTLHLAADKRRPQQRDDVAMVLHTSGSTGNKKVVPHTVEDLLSGAVCIAAACQLTTEDTSNSFASLEAKTS